MNYSISKKIGGFFAFICSACVLALTGCDTLQSGLSSEQNKELTEQTGSASYDYGVWYYNGLSSTDMSSCSTKLSDDYYDQSLVVEFGKKVALSTLTGQITLTYTDSLGLTAAKTFTSLSGSFTDDYTGYRIDMSDVLKLFDTVTIPSGTAVMTLKIGGFICAEGKQNGRAIKTAEFKNIQIKPLFNKFDAVYSTQTYSTQNAIPLTVNGPVEFEGGSYEISGKVTSPGTGETLSSYSFTVGSKDNMILLTPKTNNAPADGTTVSLNLGQIMPQGSGHSFNQDITVSFSRYKIVIDGLKDDNFKQENGAIVVSDTGEDQSAFAGLGYDVKAETDISSVSVTNDDDYLYIAVEGSLALTWSNPLVIQIADGTLSGATYAAAGVHAADTETYEKVSRKLKGPNVYLSHQPGIDNTGTGALSAFAYVSESNTDISASVKCSPEGWTDSSAGNFIEYALPLGSATGLDAGDQISIIVCASLGWNEGYAVVDACPDNSVTYSNDDHTSVVYSFTNGISYTISQ